MFDVRRSSVSFSIRPAVFLAGGGADTRHLKPESNFYAILRHIRTHRIFLMFNDEVCNQPFNQKTIQQVLDMMNSDEIDITGQQYLIQLFEQTKGDSTVQVSMYDIGDQLGLERDIASTVAQELMGYMLVEIRTLSGGIGISADGSQMARKLVGPGASSGDEFSELDEAPLLNSSGRLAVEQIASELKNQAGSLGLDFDTLTELVADLKTIDAQLGSSRPKSAIIRECLRSVLAVCKNFGNNNISDRIRTLVGS